MPGRTLKYFIDFINADVPYMVEDGVKDGLKDGVKEAGEVECHWNPVLHVTRHVKPLLSSIQPP